jgi:hypothetical protein
MDSNQILTITVFVIVITIVGTIALAVVGYMAFRLRERKHPSRPGIEPIMNKPYFFERVRIPGAGETDGSRKAFEEHTLESAAQSDSADEAGADIAPGSGDEQDDEGERRGRSRLEQDDGDPERMALSD